MHNSAGGTGSSPAPVSRYMPSNSCWNLSSNSSCRWSRRNANSFRVRFSRLMMNCSFLLSSMAGSQHFIDAGLLKQVIEDANDRAALRVLSAARAENGRGLTVFEAASQLAADGTVEGDVNA